MATPAVCASSSSQTEFKIFTSEIDRKIKMLAEQFNLHAEFSNIHTELLESERFKEEIVGLEEEICTQFSRIILGWQQKQVEAPDRLKPKDILNAVTAALKLLKIENNSPGEFSISDLGSQHTFSYAKDYSGNLILINEIGKWIAEGSFADVYEVQLIGERKIYALKVAKTDKDNNDDNETAQLFIKREQKIAKKINGESEGIPKEHMGIMKTPLALMKFEHLSRVRNTSGLLMDKFTCDATQMLPEIKTPNSILSGFQQIILGLQHLHGLKIFAADIKPDNISIQDKEWRIFDLAGAVDIGDLGLVQDSEYTSDIVDRFQKLPEEAVRGARTPSFYLAKDDKDLLAAQKRGDIPKFLEIFKKVEHFALARAFLEIIYESNCENIFNDCPAGVWSYDLPETLQSDLESKGYPGELSEVLTQLLSGSPNEIERAINTILHSLPLETEV